MPYRSSSRRIQRSRSIGHVPIVENEFIRERLGSYRVFIPEPGVRLDADLLINAIHLQPVAPKEAVRWAIAIDGSPHEVPVREEYPSTRVGYIQIGGVLVNLRQMLSQSREHLVDPAIIRESILASLYSVVLPGSNVCHADMPTVRDSWRAEVHRVFQECRVEDFSLFDIYKSLMSISGRVTEDDEILLAKCSASTDCGAVDVPVPVQGRPCPQCGQPLFPTDALRFHEDVSEHDSNVLVLNRLMQVLEHLTMVGHLEWLRRRASHTLGTIAFIFDGPLAIFGPQATLHRAILGYLHRLEAELEERSLLPPLIIGVEKSGQFVEHATAIADSIPPGHLMMLPDEYIYSRILTFRQDTSRPYGADTYYGQKFFYKTLKNQIFTLTVPKRPGQPDNPWEPRHYPRLADSLSLIEQIATVLYENALIPVALAHEYVSIPLRTGSRVLQLLSQQYLGSSDQNSRSS